MNDITALMETMKAAAESVIKNYGREWFETGCQICTVHKSKVNLISLANPANVKMLVEALDKAQRHERLTEAERQAYLGLISQRDERIASLESRTVTVKLPTTRLWAGVNECYEKADVITAIRDAGVEISND
ncbi:MAG: hypothetical protein E6017_01210 [Kluyvera cryocrescens]|nr:hypothetical protein [Kluyvera cryocrescens]